MKDLDDRLLELTPRRKELGERWQSPKKNPVPTSCSDFEDLKEYRAAVYYALQTMQYRVIAMEDYVAKDGRGKQMPCLHGGL